MAGHADNVRPLRPTARAIRLSELDLLVLVDFKRGIRAKGWTIEHTARECGCSPSAVVKYLAGKRRIPATAYRVVCGIGVANENARAA